jgi:hypothetical protein
VTNLLPRTVVMVFMDWFSFIDTKMFCSLRTWTKENIFSKEVKRGT